MMALPATLAIARNDFCHALDKSTTHVVRSMRQWAEEELVIPEGKYVGQRWSPETQPFGALLFDAIDSHQWPRHVVTGCVQSGKSLHDYVAPTLYYLFELQESVVNGIPTMDLAHDKYSKEILPAIKANRKYRALLPRKGPGSREGVGNLESVKFQNGVELKFMSAGGGDEKRSSYTARVLVATELDKYDAAGEASRETDPVSQMENRLASNDIFERRFFGECTCSIPEGRIWKEYNGGTASKIMCPCPYCREYVCPEREHLQGWKDAESEVAAVRMSHFGCPSCGHELTESDRREMNLIAKLVHRGQTIDRDGNIHGDPPETLTLGFRWNAFNNLFWSPGAIGWKEWKALRADDEESAEKELEQFYWAIPHDSPDVALVNFNADKARKRFGPSPKGEVPHDAYKVTVGADLHLRFGCFVVIAWFKDGRGHVVDYGKFDIASDDLGSQRAFLIALRDFRDLCEIGWTWQGHNSAYVPDQVWIDARYQGEKKGRRPAGDGVVYAFIHECNKMVGQRYRPCIGFGESESNSATYVHPTNKDKRVRLIGEQYHIDWETVPGVHVVKINADYWKTRFQECLSIPECDDKGMPNPGAITLYAASNTEHITFTKQIGAEHPKIIFVKGVGDTIKWTPHSSSNHYGDAAYLAKGASHHVGVHVVKTDRIAAIAVRQVQTAVEESSSVRHTRNFRPDGRPFLITNRRTR